MYLFGILVSLLVGGAFALLVRTELLAPGKTIVDAGHLQQVLHAARRGDGVPLHHPRHPGGARQHHHADPARRARRRVPAAEPRVVLPVVLGALLLVGAIPFGGLDTGWTFYTPYIARDQDAGADRRRCGVFILGFSSIFTGLNFLVTIHKFRPQGMSWFQLPLNVWAIYATAIMQVLATPVLGITRAAARGRAVRAHRHLRPDARRRPGAVPALLLVLLAPRRLHHDHPGHGRDQRADLDVLAQADLRLPLHRVLVGLARAAVVPRVGPPHVRVGPVAAREHGVLGADVHSSASRRRSRSSTGSRRSTRATSG